MTMTVKSHLPSVSAAFLLITLGVGCGSSDDAISTNGGSLTDGGSLADSASFLTDGGSYTERGTSADGESSMDGTRFGETGLTPDGASLTDVANYAERRDAADGGDAADSAKKPRVPAVNLGTAGHFAILAKSGISTVPTSAITGNLGVSPAAATYITGFSLIADPTNVFSTTPQVIGSVFAANYAVPTPSNLTTAVGDMQLAFTDAAGRAPDVTELGAGNIGGMTLIPGVYQWGTGLLIPTNVTLTGTATDVWIFQIAQDLTVSSATSILLAGGAVPKNVFWQVSGLVDLGTTAHIEGVILAQTSIALHGGASIKGRLLAQTAVTIEASTVVEPAP